MQVLEPNAANTAYTIKSDIYGLAIVLAEVTTFLTVTIYWK